MGELLKEMGQRMLDRRKQLRLTQETLAKMAHVGSCLLFLLYTYPLRLDDAFLNKVKQFEIPIIHESNTQLLKVRNQL